MIIIRQIKLLFIIVFSLLMVNCNKQSKQLVLKGEKVDFIFDKMNKNISAYVLTDADSIQVHQSKDLTDYIVLLGENQIGFNASRGVVKKGEIELFYEDSLFSASISWKMVFEDAALIEFKVVPKKRFENATLGINAIKINPNTIKGTYCLPHSLPYFRGDEDNTVPSGWISNGGTSNNTFSLITEQATYSMSVLPPEHRLENELTKDAIQDYAISFDYNEGKIDLNAASLGEDTTDRVPTGSITAIANHPFQVNKGDVIVRKFMVHVTKESEDYTTGKHLGQYMATVPYKKEANSNRLYAKSMDYLLNNPNNFNKSETYGNNYWGSIHSKTGKPYGNGTAYYAMYGNSFSIAALNQYSQIEGLKSEGQKRAQGVKDFLTKSFIQNKDGSYWSMHLLLKDQVKYSDQAFREWVWTHASAWVCYYMLESYSVSKDEDILKAAKKALTWLAQKQREDGSFPKYFDQGKGSDDNQGDSGWNALAFFKAAELNITLDNGETPDKLIQRGIKTVDWICDHQLHDKNFYGSFEDVGGVIDSYVPSIAARASLKAYHFSKEAKHMEAGKAMLTTSLAWVTCDYNTRTDEVDKFCWAKDKQWQPAYGHVESVVCYYGCSYTLPMMYLAASEYAMIAPEKKKLFWLKIAKNMSHMNDFLNNNPDSQSINGMEWRLFPFLVFTEWGNAQTCWAILKTLNNRFRLSFPEITLTADFKATIDGDEVSLVVSTANKPICNVGSEVDFLAFTTTKKDKVYIALLAEGTKGIQHLKLDREFIASIPTKNDELILYNVINQEALGGYSKQDLVNGVELLVDGAILIGIK